MRRTGISPEYKYVNTYGSNSMSEIITPFSMILVDIEDEIKIDNSDISWFELSNGTQLNLSIESKTPPVLYNIDTDKNNFHKLELNKLQYGFEKDNNTKWILSIDIIKILENYIYAKLKEARTFEGIRPQMCLNGSIDDSIRQYIRNNILKKYDYSSIELYISYTDLRSQNALRYKNTFSHEALSGEKMNKVQTLLNGDILECNFSQEKPSSLYNFKYYFNLNFKKI